MNASGPITTNGTTAFGIRADSGTILSTTGILLAGIPSLTSGPSGPMDITASGAISTTGEEAHGIWASTTTGAITVTASSVSATGEFSVGVNAASAGGGAVTMNIPQGGSVMGGWSPSPGSVGPSIGLPAAGIDLQSTSGTAVLNNAGSIGALSDLAVTGDPMIVNNGVITGFVQFSGAGNSIANNATFNLRDFEDTNGDGVRDTKRVAIADLGPGASNIPIAASWRWRR